VVFAPPSPLGVVDLPCLYSIAAVVTPDCRGQLREPLPLTAIWRNEAPGFLVVNEGRPRKHQACNQGSVSRFGRRRDRCVPQS
jgi:hypothetical protein